MANKNIMSLSIQPEMQDRLKMAAKKKSTADQKVSVSALVRDLVDRYLVDDDVIIPVFLKVPIELKGNREGLQNWVNARADAIIDKLS